MSQESVLSLEPEAQIPVAPPAAQLEGAQGFFRRHYNGDYPLGRSYWLHTVLLAQGMPFLGFLLLSALNEKVPARYGSTGFLALMALALALWLWAIVGTWSSASKHVARGGRWGWATAAKAIIVLGCFTTFSRVVSSMPVYQEHLRVALGAQLGATTTLVVRADGRSVLLSGGINDGSAEQLDAILQKTPSVTTVVFASGGGWIREGVLLADVVRKRHLNTYVEGYCASACTIAFLAGKERAAAPSAKIGFHASRRVGSQSAAPEPAETARLRELYLGAGLPASFVSKALDTPSQTMWYPPHELMLSAGVLTRRSLGGETAAVSTAVRSKEALAAELTKMELFRVLAERSPTDFGKLLAAAWEQVQRGATDAQVTIAARAQIGAILPRYLPLGSDQTLVAYQKLMQEQLEALRARDAAACVEMAFPSGHPMSVVGNLPPELASREAALMAQLIREADTARGMRPDQQAATRVVLQAMSGMKQEQIAAFASEEARRRAPPIDTCNSAIQYFKGLNAIPLAERGRDLRILYAAD